VNSFSKIITKKRWTLVTFPYLDSMLRWHEFKVLWQGVVLEKLCTTEVLP
jgi:hypothetical protein